MSAGYLSAEIPVDYFEARGVLVSHVTHPDGTIQIGVLDRESEATAIRLFVRVDDLAALLFAEWRR